MYTSPIHIALCNTCSATNWLSWSNVKENLTAIDAYGAHIYIVMSLHYNFALTVSKSSGVLSRVADTPPLLPISRYGYCLFVAVVSLCSEVLQPGGSWSSSGSGSM